MVTYVDTGSAWLAIGRPLTAPDAVLRVMEEFVADARAHRRRVAFFAVDELIRSAGYTAFRLGEQPIFEQAAWPETLKAKKSLREQLRRAKAKGVRVRRLASHDILPGSATRGRIRELAVAWLASRRMEPLQFLVALEPFHAPDEHVYLVAEREGRILAFASLIPIPARNGWLLEDILRDDDVPNGTTELLFDAALRETSDSHMLTLGLALFSGEMPTWALAVRTLTRPLYDFEGLRAFKERLHPVRWDGVYLVAPKGESLLVLLVECARAFAGGSLVGFGMRSIVRHPSGPPWALVVPLVGWIVMRMVVAMLGRVAHFAASTEAVVLWSMLDVVLAGLLFRAALRPTAKRLTVATLVAALVTARSAFHVANAGLGTHPLDVALRTAMVVAPFAGSLALAWATYRRRSFERGEHDPIALPHFEAASVSR